MARPKLGDMLAGLSTDDSPQSDTSKNGSETPARPDPITPAAPGEKRAPEKPERREEPRASKRRAPREETSRATNAGEHSGRAGEPFYQTLERKEARLRADQFRDLTEYTRSLNRARRGAGERITENTLIRVAVDLLLAKAIGEDLHGTTEAELRKSVGL